MMQQMLLIGGGIGATLPAELSVSDNTVHPTHAVASFTMNAAGTYTSSGNTTAPSGTWAIGGGAADYQFRLTVISGTFAGSATGTWLGPSVSPVWSITQTVPGEKIAEGTLEIRANATAQVLATSNLILSANQYNAL